MAKLILFEDLSEKKHLSNKIIFCKCIGGIFTIETHFFRSTRMKLFVSAFRP